MKKITLFLIIFLIGGTNAFAQTGKTKKKSPVKTAASKTAHAKTVNKRAAIDREKFNPLANPNDDLQTAIGRAQKENKRIILDVGGEWCGWCHEMDNFILRHAELNKLINENFIWWKVNFSEENNNEAFLSKYPEIKGYPHLFVLEKDGTLLNSKDTSELEDGVKSYNLKKFTDFINEYSLKAATGK